MVDNAFIISFRRAEPEEKPRPWQPPVPPFSTVAGALLQLLFQCGYKPNNIAIAGIFPFGEKANTIGEEEGSMVNWKVSGAMINESYNCLPTSIKREDACLYYPATNGRFIIYLNNLLWDELAGLYCPRKEF